MSGLPAVAPTARMTASSPVFERPTAVLLCALGGEGGGVLAEWLVETAVACGYPVQSTSIPGVAQRTGATTYYVEVFPRKANELGGRKPVFSLNPVPGAIDVLVSSELLETVRQIGNGMAAAERTHVITSDSRSLTTTEKMALGDGRASSAALLEVVRTHSSEAQVFDMVAAAQRHGTVISAVLFGAIAGSGRLPLPRAACEATIRRGGKSAEASMRGFADAFDRIAGLRAERAAVASAVALVATMTAASSSKHGSSTASTATTASRALDRENRASGLPAAAGETAPSSMVGSLSSQQQIADPDDAAAADDDGANLPAAALAATARALNDGRFGSLPPAVHDIVALGHARLLDYQDPAYARLYIERLERIVAAERVGDPAAEQAFATTRETARYLALWMAFDDIVRVADLKSRQTRLARVRREVKAGDADLLRVYDHFKPGVAEVAALLPPGAADALMRWDRRRIARGRPSFGLPLKIGIHTVFGALALRLLASLRGLRRRGSRYAFEQSMIERWLAGIKQGAHESWALGHEIAAAGRLIKGYGATNERGKENLLHVLDHLAPPRPGHTAEARATAIRAARIAALADESGTALDVALRQHQAPPRPVKEQPIQWVRSRPGGPSGARTS